MARGSWKQKVALGFVVVITLGILLAATWHAWTPNAIRWGLEFRGVKVGKVKWSGTNAIEFVNVERAQNGFVARAKSIIVLTPPAWKRALREGDTNQTFVTVKGWRIILPETKAGSADTNTTSIAEKIHKVNDQLQWLETQCPRALVLNGTLQTRKGEFNFGVVEWKGGELSGNFTWPQLNDPADFKLKLINSSKMQLIVKQIALEIGARATAEVVPDGARLNGYARWKTNRIDFDTMFANNDNTPRGGFVDSKGLAIPGRFVGMPDIETLNAKMHLVVTNGHFDLAVGASAAAERGSESGGEGR